MSQRHNRYVKEKANFLRAVTMLGGHCTKCKENRIYCLDFHHRDRTKKEATLAVLLRSADWDKIQIELEKCDLLCSNCHREEHFNKILYEQHKDEIEKRSRGWSPVREIKLRRWTKQEEERVIELYLQGYAREYIARQIQRTSGVVKRKLDSLQDQGILAKIPQEKRRRSTGKVLEKTKVWTMWDEGKSVVEISTELDSSVGYIYKILREGNRNGKSDVI